MKQLLAACSTETVHRDAAGHRRFRPGRRNAGCCGVSQADEWCPADDDEEKDEASEMIVIDAQAAIPVALSATSPEEASCVTERLMQRADELRARTRQLKEMQLEYASENMPSEQNREIYLLSQRMQMQNDSPVHESQCFLDSGCHESDEEAAKSGWWWSMTPLRGNSPCEATGASAATFSPEVMRSFGLLHDSGVDSPSAKAVDASTVDASTVASPCEISITLETGEGICRSDVSDASDASPVVGEEAVSLSDSDDELCCARQEAFETRHHPEDQNDCDSTALADGERTSHPRFPAPIWEDRPDCDCNVFADGEAQKLPSTVQPGPARPGDVVSMPTEPQNSQAARPAVNPEDPSTWPFHMKIRVFEEGFIPYAAVATAAVQEGNSCDAKNKDEDIEALLRQSRLRAFMGA